MDTKLVHLVLHPASHEAALAFLYDARRAARTIRLDGGTGLTPAPQSPPRDGEAPSTALQFALPASQAVWPVLGAGLCGWLHGHASRKVSLRDGEAEGFAHAPNDVEALLRHLDDLGSFALRHE
ncbi:MAG: hypothetical protein V4793_14430 [Paraburkholderia tropica]|uniref:Uncharacterized protein n=1 Tax=Paraburkholderia tropica TaxID=92647 RepID=A0ABX5MUB8_9BURK|nr:hypothetical protein [Paraburkholderia tropica]MDE1140692.1 hypothetical protein [Paraburkholderia tropica]PXX19156.1 hypothetical protein C7400_103147 [Paraburkholderia tropica]PZW88179.1 hypothetical protein C7399_103147 [Paraburkholderia tropica]QNB16219.1 hypothetical protein G5S35_31765 [Paraburkholderia tropica]